MQGMSTLTAIVIASLFGGVLSLLAAGFVAFQARASWIPMLVSYAIGALLGAAFLEVIPEAFENGESHTVAGSILGGILVFFLLEKLLLWRHSHEGHDTDGHGGEPEAAGTFGHGHDHGRSGALIVVGDT